MLSSSSPSTDLIDSALKLLGIRKFALAIHDSCFPSSAAGDFGRGSPYSRGSARFFRFARSLGFNAIQFGPQTKTFRDDPSPYNSAIFSKNVLSLAVDSLAEDDRLKELVDADDFERLFETIGPQASDPKADRLDYGRAWEASHRFLDLVCERFRKASSSRKGIAAEFDHFVNAQRSATVDWFERDCVFEALSAASGQQDWDHWDPIDRRLYCPAAGDEPVCARRIRQVLEAQKAAVERFALGQFLLHWQHERMRQETRGLGLRLYGDMHIGCSHQDWWAWRSLFLPGYLLGAPPSRTTPSGQPWGYPVLDPRKIYAIDPKGAMQFGPAYAFLRGRAEKMIVDFDGVRIDHPQGLVCPWVYRTDDADSLHAVQNGARLYSSPDRPDHPALEPFSIVRADQLNPDRDYPLYGDDHVVLETLSSKQIDRYAVLLDAVIGAAESADGAVDDVMCEVLSTWPAPLKAAMTRRGMGRFCITQKADPRNPNDVYRPENTSAQDWIMAGNHDTKPLWLYVDERRETVWMEERSRLLADRLVPDAADREAFAARIAAEPRQFCAAMFAELFLGPAQNVSVFFADLFGEKQAYNVPGTVKEDNWTLRVPPDYASIYARRVATGDALNIHDALAMALEAKAGVLGQTAIDLARRLRNSD